MNKIHNLFVSILPSGPRRTFLSMLRRGLTADRVENIFMLTGTGRNGKGLAMTFYEHLLGDCDYAYKANLATESSPNASLSDGLVM